MAMMSALHWVETIALDRSPMSELSRIGNKERYCTGLTGIR
ncbi:MAG: hypothetical protein ACRBBW_02770 [Cellvibrionaceae bacterium]